MLASWYKKGIGRFNSAKWQEMVDEAAEMEKPISELVLIACLEWLIEEIASTGSSDFTKTLDELYITRNRAIKALKNLLSQQESENSEAILSLLIRYGFLYKEQETGPVHIRQVDLDTAEASVVRDKENGKKGGETKEANRRAREQQEQQ